MAKEISARLEEREVSIGDVIECPRSIARDANIARVSGDEVSRNRAAISHASIAINHISKEAM